jgi:hypothetical protein
MTCSIHLICTRDFGAYAKGDQITNPVEVAALIKDRHRFARVRSTYNETAPASAEATK